MHHSNINMSPHNLLTLTLLTLTLLALPIHMNSNAVEVV